MMVSSIRKHRNDIMSLRVLIYRRQAAVQFDLVCAGVVVQTAPAASGPRLSATQGLFGQVRCHNDNNNIVMFVIII